MMSMSEPLRGEVVVTWPAFDLDDPLTGRRLVDAGLTVQDRSSGSLAARTHQGRHRQSHRRHRDHRLRHRLETVA